jgi:hypothetical protein
MFLILWYFLFKKETLLKKSTKKLQTYLKEIIILNTLSLIKLDRWTQFGYKIILQKNIHSPNYIDWLGKDT